MRTYKKRVHSTKGSYYLVLPMEWVREQGLDRDPWVEVIADREMLVRPLKGAAEAAVPKSGGSEPCD